MVVFGNNFHEKLQGVAISKEYLKYHTPFCDIVDDPDFEVDINIAVGYHEAITGGGSSAAGTPETFVQELTLNSNVLDQSTLNFYRKKVINNPLFTGAVETMRHRWANLDGYNDDFQDKLKEALKDCLNSPCNLFTETSDSIGRIAQQASTKTGDNTFGVGDLKGSFGNLMSGLDQTITNSIPTLFSEGLTELVQATNAAWSNTQAIMAGKKNLSELKALAERGESFRKKTSSGGMLSYTPDVKSYFDTSAAGSAILADIKKELGGCFDKFEHAYRYNPYSDNLAAPMLPRTVSVDGKDGYDTIPGQAMQKSVNNTKLFNKATGDTPVDEDTGAEITFPDNTKIINEDTAISKAYKASGIKTSSKYNYSIFAGFIDVDTSPKTIYTDPYDVLPGDKLTRRGIGNMWTNHPLCPSRLGNSSQFIKKALNGNASERAIKANAETAPGRYAAGWSHNISDEGMETLYKQSDKIFNDGVAISRKFFDDFIRQGALSTSFSKYQFRNEFFVAARPYGTNKDYKYFKVIDINYQDMYNVDFTVGAMKHYRVSFGKGGTKLDKNRKSIEGTEWSHAKVYSHDNLGDMEVRMCHGNIDELKISMNSNTANDSIISRPDGVPPLGEGTGTMLPPLPPEDAFDKLFGTVDGEIPENQ